MITVDEDHSKSYDFGPKITEILEKNSVAIRQSQSCKELSEGEIQLLIDDVVDFADSICSELYSVEQDEDSDIIEKIETIEALEEKVKNNKGYKSFSRDYLVATKSITISNYYSDLLANELYLMCGNSLKKIKAAYNRMTNQEKLAELKVHTMNIPVAFMSKSTTKIKNEIEYIDKLASKSKNKKFKKDLGELKKIIRRIDTVRTVNFLIAIIPAIGFFIILTKEWGEQYSKNVLVLLIAIMLSIAIYVIVFDIIICAYKRIAIKKVL